MYHFFALCRLESMMSWQSLLVHTALTVCGVWLFVVLHAGGHAVITVWQSSVASAWQLSGDVNLLLLGSM